MAAPDIPDMLCLHYLRVLLTPRPQDSIRIDLEMISIRAASSSLESVSATVYGKKDLINVIKIQISKCKDFLASSGWTPYNHSSLQKKGSEVPAALREEDKSQWKQR